MHMYIYICIVHILYSHPRSQVLLRVLNQQKRLLRELDAYINKNICIGILIYKYKYTYSSHPLFTPPFTGAFAGPQSAEAVASWARRLTPAQRAGGQGARKNGIRPQEKVMLRGILFTPFHGSNTWLFQSFCGWVNHPFTPPPPPALPTLLQYYCTPIAQIYACTLKPTAARPQVRSTYSTCTPTHPSPSRQARIYICMYVYVYIYIHIYIEREIDR